MSLTRRTFFASLAAAPLLPHIAHAREPEVFQTGGVAINGTDPVVYFTDARPDSLSNPHSVSWNGAEWQFNSAGNAAMFEADPAKYAPAFGGYCAFAASRGYLAPTVPEAWTIYEGRLYLNANLRARELWLQDIPGNIARGEANWPGILG